MMKNYLILAFLFSQFSSYSQVSLGSGVALSYTFTGNANDGSGNAFHGTVNGATLTTDRFGNANAAYDFNGTTDYINSGNILNSVFAGAGNKFSISVWVKPHVYMANNMILAKIADGACAEDQRQFYFRLWNGNVMFGYSSTLYTGNYRYPTGSTDITDTSKWYHVVVLYDGAVTSGGGMDRVKIYVDNLPETISVGAPSTGTLGNIQPGTAAMGVGDYLNTSGTQCNATAFNGKIDDIRIYDRLLNTAEIDAIFHGPATVGIAENSENPAIQLAPNPGTGLFEYTYTGPQNDLFFTLFDISGRNVCETEIKSTPAATKGILDFSAQAPGVYLLQVMNGKDMLTTKLVITR